LHSTLVKDLKIDKLSDEFGQYEILVTCRACGHTRRCFPHTLAAFATWEARLVDVIKRMRCTQCRDAYFGEVDRLFRRKVTGDSAEPAL
jgi:RNase P subunit RPR2